MNKKLETIRHFLFAGYVETARLFAQGNPIAVEYVLSQNLPPTRCVNLCFHFMGYGDGEYNADYNGDGYGCPAIQQYPITQSCYGSGYEANEGGNGIGASYLHSTWSQGDGVGSGCHDLSAHFSGCGVFQGAGWDKE